MAGYRIGVDIGGTFTDFVLVDEQTGAMTFAKHLTTPADPSRCVVDGVQDLASAAGVPLGAVLGVVHGTTLATNAVIERRGALTGMITTRGFGDLLDMGRERRYDLYDLRLTFPPPIVPRALRREVGLRRGRGREARSGRGGAGGGRAGRGRGRGGPCRMPAPRVREPRPRGAGARRDRRALPPDRRLDVRGRFPLHG